LKTLSGEGYELSTKKGGVEVELVRNQDGEEVVIGFNVEDMTEVEEEEFASTFTVEINKGEDDSLVYHCNARMDLVEVERVAFGSVKSDDVFSGPNFEELPEDVRDGFSMHLYDRHVDGKALLVMIDPIEVLTHTVVGNRGRRYIRSPLFGDEGAGRIHQLAGQGVRFHKTITAFAGPEAAAC
jgi:hypothetical protein